MFKKTLYFLIGISLTLANVAYAVQISVPSASGSGFLLQSLSNGTYFPVSLTAGTGITISTTTSNITINGTSSSAPAFTVTSYGGSTTTTLGFLGGLFSTASSTFSSNLFFTSLSQGSLYVGTNGKVGTTATTTVTCTGTTTCTSFVAFGPSPITINSTGSTVAPAFDPTSYGASTTTTLGFLGGYFSTASSTQSGNFFLSALSQGLLYTGSNSKVNSVATSTLSGSGVIAVTAGAYVPGGTPIVVSCATCGTGTVTSVTGTWPIVSSGGATPNITYAGFGTTSDAGIGNDVILYTSHTGIVKGVASSSLSLPNTALQNSTISGVALGNSLAAHTHDTSFTGTSYNGSAAVSDWGLDLSHTNTWLKLQNFNYSSSTIYSSFITSSSTNYVGGGLATCSGSTFLQYTAAGFFGCGTPAGAGTVTSVVAGVGFQNQGLNITGSGTLVVGIATSAIPVLGNIPYYTSAGDATTPAKLGTVATSSIASNSSITVTNGSTAYVLGAQPSFALNLGNTNTWTVLQNFNYSSSTLYSSFQIASTTQLNVGSGQGYGFVGSNGLFGVVSTSTLASQVFTATTFPINSIITSNASGNLIATSSDLTVSSLKSTSTNVSFFTGSLGIGTTTPIWKLAIASTTMPQLALVGSNTDNIWTMRSIGNSFYLATATPLTFATSSFSSLTIDSNNLVSVNNLAISTTSAGCASITSVGKVFSTGVACGSGSSTSPGGADTNVQFNSSGSFGGNANFTFAANKIGVSGGYTDQANYLERWDSGETAVRYRNFADSADALIWAAGLRTSSIRYESGYLRPDGTKSWMLADLVSGGGTYGLTFRAATGIGFSATNADSASDTGINRNAAGVLEINTGTPGTFGNLKVANLISTIGSSVASSTPTFTLSVGSSNTGTFGISTSTNGCAQFTNGLLWSTGSVCGTSSGLASYDAFTHPFTSYSASTSVFMLGTSTPTYAQLTIGSSTIPQLSLSDNLKSSHWTFRNSSGNLYMGTQDPVTFATSSTAAITWLSTGAEGLNDTTPDFRLEGVGSLVNGYFGLTNTVDGDIFNVSSNGNVGIGTTTPWGALSVASSTPDYTRPLFTVATSTDIFGSLFNITATSSILYPATTTLNFYDPGSRVTVGSNDYYGYGGTLDQVFVNGRINTGNWIEEDCTSAFAETGQVTADVSKGCNRYSFAEDTNGVIDGAPSSGFSNNYFRIRAGTAGTQTAVGDGMAINFNSGLPNQNIGSTTPVFETVARLGAMANASTSRIILGIDSASGPTNDFAADPTAGFYFEASSTQANWQAMCRQNNLGTLTAQINTGIATSTVNTGDNTRWQRFRIEVIGGAGPNSIGARFYIQDAYAPLKLVGTCSGQQWLAGASNMLTPITSIGTPIAGLSQELHVVWVKFWYQQAGF